MRRLALLLALAAPLPAAAAPSTLEPVIGHALLCFDHIEPTYFQEYLTTHFKPPVRTEGGAYWYKPDGVRLFNLEVSEFFVSTGADGVDFLGTVFNAPLAEARRAIRETKGISFYPDEQGRVPRAPPGSHLLDYGPDKSKLFCVKYRVQRPVP